MAPNRLCLEDECFPDGYLGWRMVALYAVPFSNNIVGVKNW